MELPEKKLIAIQSILTSGRSVALELETSVHYSEAIFLRMGGIGAHFSLEQVIELSAVLSEHIAKYGIPLEQEEHHGRA